MNGDQERGVITSSYVASIPLPNPPPQAGLSHVAQQFEEELVVPSCALEFGAQGYLCVGLSAGDVESQAPEDGDIGRSVVLAVSRQIFVEHDVERPMQAVLDGPVFAHDTQGFLTAVASAHQEVTLDGLVRAALAG